MRRHLVPIILFFTLLCAATAYKFDATHFTLAIDKPPMTAKQEKAREVHEIDQKLIRRIVCTDPVTNDSRVGTAWVYGENKLATAAHVVGGINNFCYDYDSLLPVTVTDVDWHNDFAMVSMQTGPLDAYIAVSCEGFRTGHHYIAMGWEHGRVQRQTMLWALKWQTDVDTRINGMRAIGLRAMKGTMYPGMSGGPIFDDYGAVIGINSAKGEYAYSRSLSDTALCGKPRRNDPQHSDIFKN